MRAAAAAAGRALVLLVLASLVVFALLRAAPGDPATIGLIERNQAIDSESLDALRAEWGLDAPLALQYLRWIGGFAAGDWGLSLRTRRAVAEEILARLPWSATIGGGGLLIAALAALPLGLLAALAPGGLVDRATRFLVVAVQSVPSFLLAALLAWVLAVQLGWLRVYTGSPVERTMLPLLLVGLYTLPSLARVVRSAFLLAAAQPYVLTARAKGLGKGAALVRHAGRPALLALLAALCPQASWVIGGTAVAEVVFAVPGVSQLVVESVTARDYAVLQAFVMLVAVAMAAVHAGAGFARARLDPRPRACAAP